MENKENKVNKFAQFKKNKLLVIVVGIILLFIPILLFISGLLSKNNVYTSTKISQKTVITPTPVLTELQQAINAQKNVDVEHTSWQDGIKNNYPWMRKLPMTSAKYFVYFDINKKVFIGKLYPQAGDSIDALKAEVIKKLKDTKQVPTDAYEFEWVIKQ